MNNKDILNFKMLALVASIFLSGCGGHKTVNQQLEGSVNGAFAVEDPKKFESNTALDAQSLIVTTTDQNRFKTVAPDIVQAKLTDIPIPFETSQVFACEADLDMGAKGICAEFESSLSCEDICAFYESEMELLGWQKKHAWVSHETCFLFGRPHKNCVISIRSRSDKKGKNIKSHITIMT